MKFWIFLNDVFFLNLKCLKERIESPNQYFQNFIDQIVKKQKNSVEFISLYLFSKIDH